jgi:vacuolar-type H+-ATPase subunit H
LKGLLKQYLCSEVVSKVRDDEVAFGKSINTLVFPKENILHQAGEKAGKEIETTGYRKLRQVIQAIKKKSKERRKEIQGKNRYTRIRWINYGNNITNM